MFDFVFLPLVFKYLLLYKEPFSHKNTAFEQFNNRWIQKFGIKWLLFINDVLVVISNYLKVTCLLFKDLKFPHLDIFICMIEVDITVIVNIENSTIQL